MTIWRSMFVEAKVSIVGLARGLAGVLAVGAARGWGDKVVYWP